MMPVIFTMPGVRIGISFTKALKSGLLVGVGFIVPVLGADEGFSKAEFLDPPAVFAPSFFWMWSGRITSASQIAEFDDMAAHGAGTACIHPYPKRFRPPQIDEPMDPDFLTDGYFRIYGDVLDHIERKGGVSWLYDEGGWPSGGACGRVMESDPVRFQHRYLAAGGRIETWRGNPKVEAPYPSMIEPGATERFIELAYEPYRRRFARHLGKTVPFAFTDEPSFPNKRGGGRRLPWCTDFAAEFRARKGYDIQPLCDELIASTNWSEAVVRARIDYHDVLADLFRERYLLQVREWCRANGLMFGGHLNGEDDPRGSLTQGFGHILRSMRTLDVPGVDVIWRQLFPGKGGRCAPFTKYASSAAHQNGSPYVLSETFAIYGDGLTPAQVKWLVDYQMVRGANLFVFSSYRSLPAGKDMAGGGPHFGPSDPQWNIMATYFRSVRRQCSLLSQGEPCVPTAVLFDVRGIWAGGEETETVAQRHECVAQHLLEEQRDFDFVDDDQLAAAEVRGDGTIAIGKMRYSAVVLPTSKRMRPEARAKLASFAASGGRVMEEDDFSAAPKICEVTGDGAMDTRAVKRSCGGQALYFLVNESEYPRTVRIRLDEKSSLVRADPETGRFVALPSEDGAFVWNAEGCGSMIVVAGMDADDPAPPKWDGPAMTLDGGWTMAVRRRMQVGPMHYETTDYPDAPHFAAVLGDWREILGEEFSGRVAYRVRFEAQAGGEAELDLGEVHNCCEVRLNGRAIGAKYVGPYRWRIDLRNGTNELEVTVANAIVNAVASPRVRRYIYSAFPPESVYERRVKDFNSSGHESGLYGPVTIRTKKAQPR